MENDKTKNKSNDIPTMGGISVFTPPPYGGGVGGEAGWLTLLPSYPTRFPFPSKAYQLFSPYLTRAVRFPSSLAIVRSEQGGLMRFR